MYEDELNHPLTEEQEWLAAARAGDPAPFGKLYDKHFPAVYRYALRMVGHTSGAEDLAQEAFTLAWDKRIKIRVVDQSILPWLLVTTRNLGLNRLKQLTRDSRNRELRVDNTELAGSGPGAEILVIQRQLENAIVDAVDELSPVDQTLYYLCIEEGLSYQQAANSLGTTRGAVRNRLSRLKHTLRVKLIAQQEGMS